MVAQPRGIRKPLRLIPLPWTVDHPDWLARDRELAADHLARRVRFLVEQLDLTELFGSYAGVGSAVTPPDLLLQVVLFHLHRKELSPAIWFRNATESLPVRWLLRGLRPGRSAFYSFADHLSERLVDTLNAQVLALAQSAGHTSARAAALDGTFHAAAASRHHLLNTAGLDQRCDQLDAVRAADGPPPPSVPSEAPAVTAPPPPGPPGAAAPHAAASGGAGVTPPAAAPRPASAAAGVPAAAKRPRWMARSRRGRQRQRARYEEARQTLRQRLANHAKKQKRQRKAQRKGAERVKIAPREPEAVLGKDKMKVFRPLYNTQILQDVDSAFVLGYGVYASVTDAGLLPPLLERGRELTGHALAEVLVDGRYARLLDVRYCVEHDVQRYAPVPAPSQAAPGPGAVQEPDQGKAPARGKGKGKGKGAEQPLGKEAFTWLATEHTYQCPQGHLLQLERRCGEERRDGEKVLVEQYRCPAAHCRECPLATRCTSRPDKGRTVKRLEGQELLDAVGERTQSPAGQERYRKRSQSVERLHADFKAHRGRRRFPRFGLARARGLIALLVLVHNGLALLDARAAKKAEFKDADCRQ